MNQQRRREKMLRAYEEDATIIKIECVKNNIPQKEMVNLMVKDFIKKKKKSRGVDDFKINFKF